MVAIKKRKKIHTPLRAEKPISLGVIPHSPHPQERAAIFTRFSLVNYLIKARQSQNKPSSEPAGNYPALIGRGKQAGEMPAFKG